jgi:hypothetical protein
MGTAGIDQALAYRAEIIPGVNLAAAAEAAGQQAASRRALGRLGPCVCAMTFAVVAGLIYDTPPARMSAGQWRDA